MQASQYITEGSGTITLLGSTKFWDEYIACNRELTLSAWVVLSCGHFGHSYHKHLDDPRLNVNAKILHYRKIAMSDAVCVINGLTYRGASTRAEIEFAVSKDLVVLSYDDGLFTTLYSGGRRYHIPHTLDAFKASPNFKLWSEHNSLGF